MSKISICVGCGLKVNGTTGLLEVELRPGGGILCDNSGDANDGLYLDTSAVGIIADDSATVDFTGTGSSSSHLTAAVRRSSQPCNGLRLDGDGVYAHCPDSLIHSESRGFAGGSPPFAINTGCGVPPCSFTLVAASSVSFTNNTCCTVEGYFEWIAYGGVITGATANFDATGFLTVNLNGGAFGGTPLTNIKYYGAAGAIHELGGFMHKDYHILGPSVGATTSAQFTLSVAAGSATWAVGPEFELYAHFTQTGCC